MGDLWRLTAAEAARRIREGEISSVDLVGACLERIGEIEPEVQAWTCLDPDYAMTQAKAADEWRLSDRPFGALHGVPIGLKDIIDTADMPTENGSVLHAGRTPGQDAGVVEQLRAAGLVIMGKTVTTEFATRTPGKTRNPHNPAHTPGGSSSGSAAAVAAGMVPLAIGSQTGGSTIRPASYCGIFALKPTHGLVSRHGMFQLSRSLDHVGLFGRSVEDLALLLEEIAAHDARDPDSRPHARGQYHAVAMGAPPLEPRLGFLRTDRWEQVDAGAQTALRGLVRRLGGHAEEFELAVPSDELEAQHRTIMDTEMVVNLEHEWATGRERLSAALRARIEHGQMVPAPEYLRALAARSVLEAVFNDAFAERYDAILTPAAPGTAPRGLESTGEPTFNMLWTMLGLPAVSLPLLQGGNGLPLGVQLVGPRHGDGRLLRTARWLVSALAS